jgi:hypothetical protein
MHGPVIVTCTAPYASTHATDAINIEVQMPFEGKTIFASISKNSIAFTQMTSFQNIVRSLGANSRLNTDPSGVSIYEKTIRSTHGRLMARKVMTVP